MRGHISCYDNRWQFDENHENCWKALQTDSVNLTSLSLAIFAFAWNSIACFQFPFQIIERARNALWTVISFSILAHQRFSLRTHIQNDSLFSIQRIYLLFWIFPRHADENRFAVLLWPTDDNSEWENYVCSVWIVMVWWVEFQVYESSIDFDDESMCGYQDAHSWCLRVGFYAFARSELNFH